MRIESNLRRFQKWFSHYKRLGHLSIEQRNELKAFFLATPEGHSVAFIKLPRYGGAIDMSNLYYEAR